MLARAEGICTAETVVIIVVDTLPATHPPTCDLPATYRPCDSSLMYIYLGAQVGYRPEIEQFHATDIRAYERSHRERRYAGADPGDVLKKRDFQEVQPPRTKEEFYARYDPAIGYNTMLLLGATDVFSCELSGKTASRNTVGKTGVTTWVDLSHV